MSRPIIRFSASRRGDRGGDGRKLSEEARGVDGCAIPTYAVPLSALARGFARFARGRGSSRPAAPRRRAFARRSPRTP